MAGAACITLGCVKGFYRRGLVSKSYGVPYSCITDWKPEANVPSDDGTLSLMACVKRTWSGPTRGRIAKSLNIVPRLYTIGH